MGKPMHSTSPGRGVAWKESFMVILLDKHKRPAGFTTESHLRRLTEKHRAVIYRKYPCVAILKDADVRGFDGQRTFRIKIDPGAKYTGLCVICNETDEVMLFLQIKHHGDQVRARLDTRRDCRRNRRDRETGYRRCKYKAGRKIDSSRPKDWLPPSVKSTADNIISWVRKLKKWIRITECSVEAVRFDTQLLDDPDIKGKEYQHGTLYGYEIKEYLLAKYGHTCQYCGGVSGDSILEWEHVHPKSRGGSDSVKNATLACKTCNEDKDALTLKEWAAAIESKSNKTVLDKARLEGIKRVQDGRVQKSNRYCAWVTSSRKYLEDALFDMFTDVECSSGGKTKYNRTKVLGLPKDHHYDALCVGKVPENGFTDRTNGYVLMIEAKGRGSRLRGNINSCGIIVTKYKNRAKTYRGFMSGDIVRADVPRGKHKGHHIGRITIRHSGNFGLIAQDEVRHDINCKYMSVVQKADGYAYHYERRPA